MGELVYLLPSGGSLPMRMVRAWLTALPAEQTAKSPALKQMSQQTF
jgi:hypothetical protein